MTFSVDITDDDVTTALRTFLETVTGLDSASVIQGQSNRAAPPPGPDYVVFTPLARVALAMPVETDDPGGDSINVSRSMQPGFQIDVHGDMSADMAQVLVTLFRSSYAQTQFPNNVTPLDCTDAQQLAFLTGEDQQENRWTFNAFLQITPTVSTPAQFADTLSLNLVAQADSGAN